MLLMCAFHAKCVSAWYGRRDVLLLAEVRDEASYVPHNRHKIVLIFSAMRHFAESLREDGWTVDYVQLDDDGNSGSFTGELKRAIVRYGADRILVTEPGEWRVRQDMEAWAEETGQTAKEVSRVFEAVDSVHAYT